MRKAHAFSVHKSAAAWLRARKSIWRAHFHLSRPSQDTRPL